MFSFINTAFAQDAVNLPVVPTVGVSPVVQYLLGLVSVVASVSIPLFVAFAKQHFNLEATHTRAQMLIGAISRAASLSLDLQKKGTLEADATLTALHYVKDAFPDAIAATPEATDDHIRLAIRSEVARMVHEADPAVASAATTVINVKAVGDTPAMSKAAT